MTLNELLNDLNDHRGNLSGVYKITRKSDGRIYIGQSTCIVDRIKQHIKNSRALDASKIDFNKNIDAAIQRDGWENFTYEVLVAYPEMTSEQLWMAEGDNITYYNSYEHGFNRTKGNHIGKYDKKEYIKALHVISAKLIKDTVKHFNLRFSSEKNVLLIGNFSKDFLDKLKWDLDEDNYNKQVSIVPVSQEQYDKKNHDAQEEFYITLKERLNELKDKHFDIIIANPPYGKVGANITKFIIDNIDFDEYVNLLPANDYKRNDTKDLYQFVELDTMQPVINGFDDAAVTTHIAKISKKRHNYISWDEFQIENYIDSDLTKYFYENLNRKHYAFNVSTNTPVCDFYDFDIHNTVVLGAKDVNHQHLPFSKDCVQYKWNVEESVNADWIKEHYACKNFGKENQTSLYVIKFAYPEEKKNLVEFMFSKNGFRFLSKLWHALNVDSYISPAYYLPKVDWTRSWTVEEILKEYNYSEEEIKKVMNDLDNFKYMED